jgi:hypothetical protein
MASGAGAISSQAVIAVDRVNYGLSTRGFFMTDGNSVTPLGDKEGINDYVFKNIASSEYAQVAAIHNKDNNEVVWSLPIGDASKCTTEITYNYSTGIWSKRTHDVSASAELSGTVPYRISGDSTGAVFIENGATSPHNTTATTRAHDFDDPFAIKELTSIRVGKSGFGKPTLEVGWSDSINDDPTFNPDDSFEIDDSFREYNVRTSGRFLFLRISSEENTDTWEISHIAIKGRIRGFR